MESIRARDGDELGGALKREHQLAHDLGERVKELTLLHQAARLLQEEARDLEETLGRLVSFVPPAFQFPEITAAALACGTVRAATSNFQASPWQLSARVVMADGTPIAIDVAYLEERPVASEGPFLAEERRLLDSIAEMLVTGLERRLAIAKLRESERNLYDALGIAGAERERAQLLLDVTTAVASELDLRSLVAAISRLLTDRIPHHFASVALWEPKEQRLRRHGLVFPAGRGVVVDGALVGKPSPSYVAFERGSTVLLRWQDIEALGEPAVSVMAAEGLRSVCCVPLTTARASYGTLNVGKPEDVAFSPDEVTMLEQVARPMAVAFENALTFQRAEEYRREASARGDRLQALLAVNNALVSQLEPHALRPSVLGVIRRLLDHDYASYSIFDPDARTLTLEAVTFYDERGVQEPHLELSLERSPSGITFTAGVARVFDEAEIEAFDPAVIPVLHGSGLRSVCCIPLLTQRGPLGVLNVGRRNRSGFTSDEVDLLGDVARQIAIAIENTLAYQEISALKDQLAEEKLYLEDEITDRHDFKEIVGHSPSLSAVLQQIRTVAPTDATVLLLGETGTGKELLARAVHDASLRRERTFVRVNGAALPSGLIESELFGYEKGAFTGAAAAKVGRLELAHRGTLFLDEVGDIPMEVQPKLLRALQEQEFERLGSTRTQRVDVRLIAATNRDLERMVSEGTFRSDLYYRLSVFPIMVPPLRDRPEDIPPLIQHFVGKFARDLGRPVPAIPATAMELFQRWHWPGNIRELQNVIERAVILTPGTQLQISSTLFDGAHARAAAAPPARPPAAPPAGQVARYTEGERDIILRALRDAHGVISGPDGAAARLGLKRTTLHSKMRKLGIERPTF